MTPMTPVHSHRTEPYRMLLRSAYPAKDEHRLQSATWDVKTLGRGGHRGLALDENVRRVALMQSVPLLMSVDIEIERIERAEVLFTVVSAS